MKERPILFNGEMVRAILDGRKTMTRRIVKPQPPFEPEGYECGPFYRLMDAEPIAYGFCDEDGNDFKCPYGQPGDRLWVRETWCPVNDEAFDGEKWIDYRATPKYEESHPAGWDNAPGDPEALSWKPSIHMPRWASRILLEITSVRVERLQEITPNDCEAEGIQGKSLPSPVRGQPYEEYNNGDGLVYTSPTLAFRALWESINGKKHPWESNPWVWVIEFKRL